MINSFIFLTNLIAIFYNLAFELLVYINFVLIIIQKTIIIIIVSLTLIINFLIIIAENVLK
jgi:hypothetical protein